MLIQSTDIMTFPARVTFPIHTLLLMGDLGPVEVAKNEWLLQKSRGKEWRARQNLKTKVAKLCFSCGGPHYARQCAETVCHYCARVGHLARDCSFGTSLRQHEVLKRAPLSSEGGVRAQNKHDLHVVVHFKQTIIQNDVEFEREYFHRAFLILSHTFFIVILVVNERAALTKCTMLEARFKSSCSKSIAF